MYGFGDDQNPSDASVDLLEIYVEEFITNLVGRSLRRRLRHGDNQIKVADVLEVLKTDEKKYLRMPYILTTAKEFSMIRTELDENKKLKTKDLPGSFNIDKLSWNSN